MISATGGGAGGEIQVMWRTDELRSAKLEVRDEVRNGLYYVRESLFEAVPKA
jgi:phosphoenolpyruvate carboxylase